MNFYNSAPEAVLRAASFLPEANSVVCDGCLCLSNGVSMSYVDFQAITCSICTSDLQVIKLYMYFVNDIILTKQIGYL